MTNSSIDLSSLEPGSLVANRYKIKKLLGTGGMGAVYLCEDNFLEGSNVAVKVLHKEFSTDANIEKRFLREIQLMNSVSSPYVVRTFDAGRFNDTLYFTMEFVAGIPLDDFIVKNGKLGIPLFCNIAIQIAEGIDAIHRASIIHRDLKPSNIILLEDGSIKITDFGVAKPKTSKLTQHNEIIGSVDYIAPEIWLGKETTSSVDLYSLGIIFYQMLTNNLPFAEEEATQMMMSHVKRPPTPPLQYNSEIPGWLNHLILKMLAKSPNERPRSAAEISKNIQTYSENLNLNSGRSKIQSAINSTLTSGNQRSVSKNPLEFSQQVKAVTGNKSKQKKSSSIGDIFLFLYIISGVGLAIYFYLSLSAAFKTILLLK